MDFDFTSAVYAILIAFVANIILCPIIIPFLTKLKFGQNVRNDGPQTHLVKAGTPTMGGIMILISLLIASVFFLKDNMDAVMVIFVTVGYGIIGFIDDYIKVVKKRSLGFKAYQKLICQLIVTGVFLYYIYNYTDIGTNIYIPFTDKGTINLGSLYIPFFFFVTVFFMFAAKAMGSGIFPVAGAAVGALLGFLLFNAYPARVFMGDTGSLALGGFIASMAVLMKMPIILIIVGFIYVCESLSVIIQVLYFKVTHGKRIFKMAPLHHHFEQCGWKETKVVTLFYVITSICCLVGFLATKNFF